MDGFVTFSRIANLQQFFSTLIAPGSLCFDVGANYGEQTAALLSLQASVVAIEPQPKLAEFILEALGDTAECGNLKVVKAALGRNSGIATLYPASDHTKSMSTLSETFLEVARANGVPWDISEAFDVEMHTLDGLINAYSLPDYVKIDVEGYEMEVLSGLTSPIELISFEYNTQPRLIGIAIDCINYVSSLGDYSFNYHAEVVGQQQLQLGAWVTAPVMRYILKHDIARQTCFGDIFARRRRKAKN